MTNVATEPRPDECLEEHVADGRNLRGTTLILASHNSGKLAEMQKLLAPYDVTVTSVADLEMLEPEETGTTFEDNAILKATAAMEGSGLPALADDSGLTVDALGGAPGVYTADWATTETGERDFAMGMEKVYEALLEAGATDEPDRRGRFVSVLCLAWPDGATELFRGEVEGHLVWPPRGSNGFGFDPMFRPEGFDRTFAEMTQEQKRGDDDAPLSHRARALRAFIAKRLAQA